MENKKIEIRTEEQYINRDFQDRISEFLKDDQRKKKILVVDAPTGAGKTHAFKSLKDSSGITFLVLPNNFLIEEKYVEFAQNDMIGSTYIAKLSRAVIDQTIENQGLKYNGNQESVLEAIDFILSNSSLKLIITNPSILFLILYNYYWNKIHKKGSHLSELIVKGLINLIFDEIHIYTKDQRNRILAINALLNENVKFGYSSATIPKDLLPTLNRVFGENSVEYVRAKTSSKNDSVSLLRGPVLVELFDVDPLSLPESIVENLRENKWIIILNKIKTINSFYKRLREDGKIASSDIKLLSGYHERSRTSIKEFTEGKYRIMITSNIIEQGINPPKDYVNFIIEPGIYYYNFIQRIGRVGRGIDSTTRVIIPIGNVSIPQSLEEFNDFNQVVEEISKLLKREDESEIPLIGLGHYIGSLISSSRFDYDHRKKFKQIVGNLSGASEILKGIEYFEIIENFINKMNPKDCRGFTNSKIDSIKSWWKSYNYTFQNFIKSEELMQVVDESLKEAGISDFVTSYSEIWIHKNKDILGKVGNANIVGEDRNEEFKEFPVILKNIPFSERRDIFKNVEWNERRLILEGLQSYEDKFRSCPNGKGIFELIKWFLVSTAWPDRILIKVDDPFHES